MPMSSDSPDKKTATRNILFLDYGIGFGGAVISMAELVNNLPDSLRTYVLSAQTKRIILPLLKKSVHVFFLMPVNYLLRDRLRMALERMGSSRAVIVAALKAYAAVDLLIGYYYSIYIYFTFKKYQIDLLHINNHVDFNGIRAAAWAGIPCVTHCRGFVNIEKRITNYKPFDATVRKFIAISQAVAENLRQGGIAGDKIEVIHNPIQWEKYDSARLRRDVVRSQWGFAPDEVVVAIFGRITAWKGQLEFLQAVAEIIADCPKMRIMIVGDSSDDTDGYSRKVEEFSQQGALRGRVVFVGYQQDVFDYYWASDIVVHNSIDPEPFGRVVIEAMACDCAVVAMAEGGPMDIIRQDHDGILVPPRDRQALAQAMQRLYRSPADRIRFAANARTSIQQNFSGEVIARRVLGVYEDIFHTTFS